MFKKHLTVRMEKELYEKLRVVARDGGRSLPREVEKLVRNCIEEFERVHGEIPMPPSPEDAGEKGGRP